MPWDASAGGWRCRAANLAGKLMLRKIQLPAILLVLAQRRTKLLATLTDLLHKKQRRKQKHQAQLKKLLKKLKKKEIQLEEKVLMEKVAQKRKRMDTELQIVTAQLAKGLETLQDLEQT